MKIFTTLLASTALALGTAAIAQTDDTKLKGAERAAAQKQERDDRAAARERNPLAATPATPATPAVPPEPGSGAGATPAVPATPALPSSKSTDTTTTTSSGTTSTMKSGSGKTK